VSGVARNDRRTLAGLSPTSPRETTTVLSRPNPADDETLVYCTCGSPPKDKDEPPPPLPAPRSSVHGQEWALWCPRICFSPSVDEVRIEARKSYIVHEASLRNEIPLRKEKRRRKAWLPLGRIDSRGTRCFWIDGISPAFYYSISRHHIFQTV